ncbi:type II CAAX endopeptidase family protein [Ruminococcus sp.]|uniref:CPBP family intramembrane glutamic endopeptidase n=1 Tax=Ruminococcus sp. TaxID=41978 RepID=UPI0025DDDD33|nr:type II CAAX endopeptidase family protein [Ruminococcus sp.]MBQ6251515.1 CPBP family intramembrane metalloprotease [Ruminococcus sp.]
MNETQGYSAEYAALNHEIYSLTKQLEAKERELKEKQKTDVYDPFDNPSEYHWYNDDYSEILPWITMPEFSVPFEPAKVEKNALRKYYNIGGFIFLFQFLFSNVLALLLISLIQLILGKLNPDAASGAIEHYMRGGSIFVAINLIIYLAANVGFAFIGLKWAKIKPSFMLNTRDYSFSDAVVHCLAGLFIWICAGFISSGIDDIFSQYGFSTDILDHDYGKTALGFAIMTIYSCIIAPLTEEIMFRGALMKIFSKADRRFAIFMSAVFFGLAHGNIPQFMLAFLIGIFFGHIDMKHNSIIPSVVVHIFINSMVTVISLLKDNDELMGLYGLALIAGSVVGLILLIIFRVKNKLPMSTPAQKLRGISVAKTSVGCIIAVVIHIGYMALNIIATKQ